MWIKCFVKFYCEFRLTFLSSAIIELEQQRHDPAIRRRGGVTFYGKKSSEDTLNPNLQPVESPAHPNSHDHQEEPEQEEPVLVQGEEEELVQQQHHPHRGAQELASDLGLLEQELQQELQGQEQYGEEQKPVADWP